MIKSAWYGAGEREIRLAARCDADGEVSLTLSNGQIVEPQAASLAVDNGTVLFVFDLPANSEVTGVVAQGGVAYRWPMRIRTLPTTDMRLLVYSCAADQNAARHAYAVMAAHDPHLVLCLGDFIYADANSGTVNGVARTNVRTVVIASTGASVYRPHYDAVKAGPEWQYLASRSAVLCMWHDHEIFDGYTRGSINNINKYAYAAGAEYDPTAVEQIPNSDSDVVKDQKMQAIYDAAYTAWWENWGITNPPNLDAGIDADALYFRVRVGNLVEIIVPDVMTYGDMSSNRNGNAYTDLPGYPYYTSAQDHLRESHHPTQQAWILDRLAAAEADGVAHKILASPVQPYEHNSDALNNGNTLARCTTERDQIVAAFSALTSAVLVAGDSHQGCAWRDDANSFVGYEPCSMSSGIHQQGTGYAEMVAFKLWGNDGQPSPGQTQWVFGVVDITPDRQIHRMVDAHNGLTVWGPLRVRAGLTAVDSERVMY